MCILAVSCAPIPTVKHNWLSSRSCFLQIDIFSWIRKFILINNWETVLLGHYFCHQVLLKSPAFLFQVCLSVIFQSWLLPVSPHCEPLQVICPLTPDLSVSWKLWYACLGLEDKLIQAMLWAPSLLCVHFWCFHVSIHPPLTVFLTS